MAKKKTTKPRKTQKKKPTSKVKEPKWEAPDQVGGFSFVSDTKNMNDPGAYFTLVYFIALPRVMRERIIGVGTQEELAKKMGVSEKTLSCWKNRTGFSDDVQSIRAGFFRERTADALLSLENKAIKTGDASEVKLLLQYTGELKQDDDKNKVPQLLAEAIKNISTVLDT